MKDSRRLLDDGATPLERELLEAWRMQRGPSRARQRALGLAMGTGIAVGAHSATAAGATKTLGAAAVGAAGAGEAAGGVTSMATAGLAKWIGVSAVLVALGGGAMSLTRNSPTPQITGAAKFASAPATPSGPAVESRAHPASPLAPPLPAAAGTTEEAPESSPPREREPDVKPRARAVSTPAITPRPTAVDDASPEAKPNRVATTSPTDEGLAPLLALLQGAREDLANGRPDAALSRLDAFDARHPGSALGEEAAILRFDALVRMGEGERAKVLARTILANNPRSPYASRLRRAIEASP